MYDDGIQIVGFNSFVTVSGFQGSSGSAFEVLPRSASGLPGRGARRYITDAEGSGQEQSPEKSKPARMWLSAVLSFNESG